MKQLTQLEAVGSITKHTAEDGSFHDSGRNAGQRQGQGYSGVWSFHEVSRQGVELRPWMNGSWDGKLTLAAGVGPSSQASVAFTLIVIAGRCAG